MDIKDYILWGGGALIALVVLHGLWMAWRRSVHEPAQESDGVNMHQSDLALENAMPVAAPAIGHDNGVAMARSSETGPDIGREQGLDRVEPMVGVDWHANGSLDELGELGERAAMEQEREQADAATSAKHGRRVVIPGKRTEPTVPRTSRLFDRQLDAAQAQPTTEDGSANGLNDVVVIWVVAKPGTSLEGHDLLAALAANHLQYSGDVFRKLDPNTDIERYKVVNGVEPGTFDLSDLDALSTPRIVMLLRFSARNDAAVAFEDMLEVAQDMASTLDAELKDERMSDMSGQTIEHCRQRIREYKRMSIRK